ncbi:MAG: hypothetical protein ABIR32_01100 [Ilumatobacteraceae bacterium]
MDGQLIDTTWTEPGSKIEWLSAGAVVVTGAVVAVVVGSEIVSGPVVVVGSVGVVADTVLDTVLVELSELSETVMAVELVDVAGGSGFVEEPEIGSELEHDTKVASAINATDAPTARCGRR